MYELVRGLEDSAVISVEIVVGCVPFCRLNSKARMKPVSHLRLRPRRAWTVDEIGDVSSSLFIGGPGQARQLLGQVVFFLGCIFSHVANGKKVKMKVYYHARLQKFT
jgi:hypothetical protein